MNAGETVRRRARIVAGTVLLASLVPVWAATRTLVVSGLGGEPRYAEAFAQQAESAAQRVRASGAEVTLLTGSAATATAVQAALERLAGVSEATDVAALILLGHGSYDGETYRFNVPGPDPTGADLADWLDPLEADRQLVVVATSASGAATEALRREGRTVVTATKSGTEQGATVFGEYWVEALGATSADTDKDGRIGATEAFRFAIAAVERHFESRGLMATEHARLEGPETGVVLSRLAPERLLDAASRHLVARRTEIEAQIAGLRRERESMDIEAYFARLQELLLELAVIERDLEDGS